MRQSRVMWRVTALGLLIVQLLTICALGAESDNGALQELACRITGSALVSRALSGSVGVEAAAGLNEVMLSVSGDLPRLPLPDGLFGGSVGVSRDWLDLSIEATYDTALRRVLPGILAYAAPPPGVASWQSFVLLGGLTAQASVRRSATSLVPEHRLLISPYASATSILGSNLVLSLSAGVDILQENGDRSPSVVGSRLQTQIDVGDVRLSTVTQFAGTLSSFVSQSVSIVLTSYGLGVDVTIFPLPAEERVDLRVGLSVLFGDGALLPSSRSTGGGLVCTGDTCYVP